MENHNPLIMEDHTVVEGNEKPKASGEEESIQRYELPMENPPSQLGTAISNDKQEQQVEKKEAIKTEDEKKTKAVSAVSTAATSRKRSRSRRDSRYRRSHDRRSYHRRRRSRSSSRYHSRSRRRHSRSRSYSHSRSRRHARSRSRSDTRSRRRARSKSRSRRHSKSRSRSASNSGEAPKNTLAEIIKNVEKTVQCMSVIDISCLATKSGIIPNFDLIEPRCAYGKDLYVGNIAPGCHAEDIVEFLNKAMVAANLNRWPGKPVLSCRILPKFCFVSLRHEDEATNALNLDGIYFHGQRLKISLFWIVF